ncbi:MAG: carbon storage regulator [Gammaproteobacteria bacterium GWE2_37_16]|nr:MAG: carbon storage regulator [Gammaproteobacteria bacterium GWE2_37_16]
MLILTRKAEESVIIGNNIEVKVLKTDSGQVCLGITAPKDIPVHREEIYAKIRNQQQPKWQVK